MNSKKITYIGNGIMVIVNFILFLFLIGDDIVVGFIEGMGFKWYLGIFNGIVFILMNLFKYLIVRFNMEDKFVFILEIFKWVNYLVTIAIGFLCVKLLIESLNYSLMKVIIWIGLLNCVFNGLMLIFQKDL